MFMILFCSLHHNLLPLCLDQLDFLFSTVPVLSALHKGCLPISTKSCINPSIQYLARADFQNWPTGSGSVTKASIIRVIPGFYDVHNLLLNNCVNFELFDAEGCLKKSVLWSHLSHQLLECSWWRPTSYHGFCSLFSFFFHKEHTAWWNVRIDATTAVLDLRPRTAQHVGGI